jgi:hypothetical protein
MAIYPMLYEDGYVIDHIIYKASNSFYEYTAISYKTIKNKRISNRINVVTESEEAHNELLDTCRRLNIPITKY